MTEEHVTHIELADPQGQLLAEIADPAMKRRDVAMTYRLARSSSGVDWPHVNAAIIGRWSMRSLSQIKDFAWGNDRAL